MDLAIRPCVYLLFMLDGRVPSRDPFELLPCQRLVRHCRYRRAEIPSIGDSKADFAMFTAIRGSYRTRFRVCKRNIYSFYLPFRFSRSERKEMPINFLPHHRQEAWTMTALEAAQKQWQDLQKRSPHPNPPLLLHANNRTLHLSHQPPKTRIPTPRKHLRSKRPLPITSCKC
jgi:hypothetical protein